MLNLIIGILFGMLIMSIIISISNYLIRNNRELKWKNMFLTLIILFFIVYITYSIIGTIVTPNKVKENGNICKGYKYGIKICSGDINAE